jgi:ABC-type proline/glycine betaine transport system permease subunit
MSNADIATFVGSMTEDQIATLTRSILATKTSEPPLVTLAGQFLRLTPLYILILAGVYVTVSVKSGSPLQPYLLQILGLLFVLPIVALLAMILKLPSEVVTGLLGTIVGYIFGTSTLPEKADSKTGSSTMAQPAVHRNDETETSDTAPRPTSMKKDATSSEVQEPDPPN